MKGSFLQARRAERSDRIFGIALALGLPFVSLLAAKMLDISGEGEESWEGGAFSVKEEIRDVPMSKGHAEAVLKELKRLYEENYAGLFLSRLKRKSNTPEGRIREFRCADYVIGRCQNLVKKLQEGLREADSDNAIKELAPGINAWAEKIEDAQAELEKLNPIPKSMRQ